MLSITRNTNNFFYIYEACFMTFLITQKDQLF